MNSDFLSSEQEQYESGGLGALAGSLYGWSVLSMLSDFSTTGEYVAPWTGMIKKGGFRTSAVGKKWGIKAAEPIVLGKSSKYAEFGTLAFGKKFVGAGKFGAAQLMASRAAGLYMSSMTWTDPAFFAFRYLAQPWMWGVGAAYFGAWNTWRNASRAMERTRYVDMSVMFPETQSSFTSRQRAVRAISESHLQARAAIGNEAQLFHR